MQTRRRVELFMELLGVDVAAVSGVDLDQFTPEEIELFQRMSTELISQHLSDEDIEEYLGLMKAPIFKKVFSVGATLSPQLITLARDIAQRKLRPFQTMRK